jgi:type II secretory pathway pseudopilin PulG
MKSRRGTTLVEMVIFISISASILSVSAPFLYSALRSYAKSQEFADVERSLTRLARQFRSDVHRATAAVVKGDDLAKATLVKLTIPSDRSIEYQQTTSGITRLLLQDGKIKSREEYSLPSSVDASVQIENNASIIALSLLGEPDSSSSNINSRRLYADFMPVICQIEAALGRDLRFDTLTIASENAQ